MTLAKSANCFVRGGTACRVCQTSSTALVGSRVQSQGDRVVSLMWLWYQYSRSLSYSGCYSYWPVR